MSCLKFVRGIVTCKVCLQNNNAIIQCRNISLNHFILKYRPLSSMLNTARCRLNFVKPRTGLPECHIKSVVFLRNLSTVNWNTGSFKNDTQSGTTDEVDPFQLVQDDLKSVCDDIRKELTSGNAELCNIARYHFDGQGKSFRPMLAILVARACNIHNTSISALSPSQKLVALIAEMIHTASLLHDDVVDSSETRRGKQSVQKKWGQRKAILTGDFIISTSSQMLARIRNEEVVIVLSKVLDDLVKGEFMQLGSKEDKTERFHHYLRKTYKKTASLMANSCKAVAILGDSSNSIVETAFQFGQNIGVAFQLVDDILDFTSCDQVLGKPTAADLQLGLATAPVLFAAQQHPDLQALIMRRFSEPGDVATARHLVAKSSGVEQTLHLVDSHSREAVRLLSELKPCAERQALIQLTNLVRARKK